MKPKPSLPDDEFFFRLDVFIIAAIFIGLAFVYDYYK